MPCSAFFSTNSISPTLITDNSWDFDIVAGFNRLLFATPVFVRKGSFIYLTQSTGKIAIDKSGNATYSDMVLSNGGYYKLNDTSNWRIFLNTITSFGSYKTSFLITYTYSALGNYEIMLTFISSNVTFFYDISVTQCNNSYNSTNLMIL